MLEACGLKGHRIGGASISPRHANFIENEGGATSADAIALMAEARRRVHERFGVGLEHEVSSSGRWPYRRWRSSAARPRRARPPSPARLVRHNSRLPRPPLSPKRARGSAARRSAAPRSSAGAPRRCSARRRRRPGAAEPDVAARRLRALRLRRRRIRGSARDGRLRRRLGHGQGRAACRRATGREGAAAAARRELAEGRGADMSRSAWRACPRSPRPTSTVPSRTPSSSPPAPSALSPCCEAARRHGCSPRAARVLRQLPLRARRNLPRVWVGGNASPTIGATLGDTRAVAPPARSHRSRGAVPRPRLVGVRRGRTADVGARGGPGAPPRRHGRPEAEARDCPARCWSGSVRRPRRVPRRQRSGASGLLSTLKSKVEVEGETVQNYSICVDSAGDRPVPCRRRSVPRRAAPTST